MAVYWQDREWWYGALTAFGGSSSQDGNGGAGTVYLEVSLCLEQECERFDCTVYWKITFVTQDVSQEMGHFCVAFYLCLIATPGAQSFL